MYCRKIYKASFCDTLTDGFIDGCCSDRASDST